MDPIHFSDAEKASFRTAYAPGANDEQWSLFIQECERRALIPGTHVVFQTRNATEYNAQLNRRVSVQKVTMITTINALRLIAERTGKYDGHGPFIYYYGSEDGSLRESKIQLGKIPHAVSVEGFRKDWKQALFATARYEAYVQMKEDNGQRRPTQMWTTRGEEQLAKCCEALMLRTVAPEECAGLYLTEELQNDLSTQEDESPKVQEKVTLPEATKAPTVNQAAAKTDIITGKEVPLMDKLEYVALVAAARSTFSNALNRGQIVKQPCAICGDLEVQGHHTDYRKALEVVWLCLKHHREAHVGPHERQLLGDMTKNVTIVTAEVAPTTLKTADVVTAESTPKPQSSVNPEAPQAPPKVEVKCTSGQNASLFTETNRPDPAHETMRLPEPLPVSAELKEALKKDAAKAERAFVAAVSTPTVPEVKKALATVAAAPAAVIVAAATAGTDTPATSAEYAVFINQRASKIIRDKLPKAGLKDASAATGVKNYLLKGADKKALNKISATDFERLLTALESVTPEQARDIVLAVK